MTETIINTESLHEVLLKLIPTEKVYIKQINGEVRLKPIGKPVDYMALSQLG